MTFLGFIGIISFFRIEIESAIEEAIFEISETTSIMKTIKKKEAEAAEHMKKAESNMEILTVSRK